MAITNAQQYQQLVNPPMKGKKRPGYRGSDMGKERGPETGREPGPVGGGRGVRGDRDPMAQFSPEAAATAKKMRDATMGAGDRFVPDFLPTTKAIANLFQVSKPTPFDIQRRGFIQALGPRPFDAQGFGSGQSDSQGIVGIPTWMRLGFSSEAEYLASLEKEDEKEDEGLRLAFRADGGRIGLQEGGGIEQRLEKLGGDVTSAEKLLQGINKRLETAESSLGSGGGGLGSIAQPFIGGIAQPLPRPGPFMGRPLLQPINATLPETLEAVQPLEAAQPILAGRPIQQPPPIPAGAMTGGTITADNTLDEIIAASNESMANKITPLFGMNDGGGLFSPLRFDNLNDAFKFAQRNAEVLRRGTDFTGPQAPILDANTGKFAPFAGELSFDDFSKNFSLQDGALIRDPNLATAAGFGGVPIFNTTTDPNFFGIGAEGLTPQEFTFGGQNPQQAYLNNIAQANARRGGIPAAGYADGGNVVGGEYDFESARQMYGLGKLVKKVTRTVKKIAKSPIGKAALLYAGGSYLTGANNFFGGLKGAGIFSKAKLFGTPALTGSGREFFMGMGGKSAATKGILGKLGLTAGGGSLMPTALGGITAASALAGLLTPKQEEEAEMLAAEKGIDIEAARNSILARAQGNIPGDFRARGFRAEGGPAEGKEPVAKKTMPLLDMGGQEMDLRAEGGFVPIGRMEKADDVPARLSKNEFVFTADAVRNAGDGDVDKGAEVMYNMMKNLEAGGEVSEESQGLEGARKMFQTSQRLEEVL